MNPSLRPALGSLAAMAAMAFPLTAKSQVVVSPTLTNVTIPLFTTRNIDFDNNGITDFVINNNSQFVFGYNSANLLFSNGSSLRVFNFGDTIGPTGDTSSSRDFNLLTGGSGYIGVTVFGNDGEQHAGWIHFDLTGGGGSIKIINAAYEATPGVSIAAGATTSIPEPANVATGIGLVAGLMAWMRRRRTVS